MASIDVIPITSYQVVLKEDEVIYLKRILTDYIQRDNTNMSEAAYFAKRFMDSLSTVSG